MSRWSPFCAMGTVDIATRRPVRHNEDVLNEELAQSLDLVCELAFDDPHCKAQLLLHARLRGTPLPIADYVTDTRTVLENCSRVLAALVDVAADAGALRTTLALCRLSQALGSASSFGRDELCQLPGMDDDRALRFRAELGLGRDEGIRAALTKPRFEAILARTLAVPASQCRQILGALRTEVTLEVALEDPDSGEAVAARVECEAVCAVRISLARRERRRHEYSSKKEKGAVRGWWFILAEGDELLALKRVSMPARAPVLDAKLVFAAPETPGPTSLQVLALADDCRGFDAQVELSLDVIGGAAPADAVAEAEPEKEARTSSET